MRAVRHLGGQEEEGEHQPDVPTVPAPRTPPCSPGGLPSPRKADASLLRASVDLRAPVKPCCIALKWRSHMPFCPTGWGTVSMAAHLLSQPWPGSWRFVAHECQPRCDDGSERCSWFPQFFIPSQISCLLFSHGLTEVLTCIPYISPTLSRQCNEFRFVFASTPTGKVQHTSDTARIPLHLFMGHLQPQVTTHVISVPGVLLFFTIPWFLPPCYFPGNSPGVGCHFLLQGIFPTWGSNPGLQHCRQTLHPLSHQGSPFHSNSHQWNQTVCGLCCLAFFADYNFFEVQRFFSFLKEFYFILKYDRGWDGWMVGWHHQLSGHEQALGVGDGQGSLVCCSAWGRRVGHGWATELIEVQLINKAVWVSGILKSDSIIHIPVSIFFFEFFSRLGYCRVLSWVTYDRQ